MAKLQITDKEKRLAVKLAVLGAVSFGLVWGGEKYVTQFTSDGRTSNEALKTEENDYKTRLSRIQDEERLQNQFVESYKRYQERGLILGSEFSEDSELATEQDEIRRLALLERLQEIQQNRKLFSVVSRLTRPTNLPSSFSEYTAESNVAVRTNVMNVTMPMLHSLDMLMFLNDFYDDADNRFVPVHCQMIRSGGFSDNPDELLNASEKLDGECDLVWLTIFDPLQGKVTGADDTEGQDT